MQQAAQQVCPLCHGRQVAYVYLYPVYCAICGDETEYVGWPSRSFTRQVCGHDFAHAHLAARLDINRTVVSTCPHCDGTGTVLTVTRSKSD